nr:hypothetical protein [Tanacetum cinerariifolium]
MNQNFYNSNSSGFDQIQPLQYPVVHHPLQETNVEILQAKENLMKFIQTFLKKFNRISFRETLKVLSLAWEKFFEIQHAQPEDKHEMLRKFLEDLQIIKNSSNAITPDLPTEEPDNFLMSPRVFSTIHVMCLFYDNLPPLDVLNDHFELFFDFNDDCTSSDNDYFKDIDFIETSPPDSELVSLKEVKDDIFRKKLLNINLLIVKIESLNDNPPLLIVCSSLLPHFLSPDHTEETSSDSTTTHADNSLPEYDSFLFEIEPDQGELTSIVMEDILGEPHVHVPNVLPTHPTLLLDSDFIPSDDSLGSDL